MSDAALKVGPRKMVINTKVNKRKSLRKTEDRGEE
jgi:hypothetical protein